MSKEYTTYMYEHIGNVEKAYTWLKDHIPNIREIQLSDHDDSKFSEEEYEAYDKYFYGGNKSYEVVENFKYAWLHHIHTNPHHWQYWVLINDEPEEGIVALDMPDEYIIEMICDWWSFSWKTGNLSEIFDWYDKHKEHMILSDTTRSKVEGILDQIKRKLSDE